MVLDKIEPLLEMLALYGGHIVSTASLSPMWIDQARESGRMYVNEMGLGYVWEPPVDRFPETLEEVILFEKWFPLQVELPDGLKDYDKFVERIRDMQLERKQSKLN